MRAAAQGSQSRQALLSGPRVAGGAFAGLWDCQSRHRSARKAASERTVPTHSGASPRPDVRASGLTCPTRRTCVSSQRQQVAPDSPPSPQSWWATRPGALASGMEADGDLKELARLRSVFAACDANRSGRLEREEFRALCAELRVRPADAEAVFQRLDADRDGAITFQEFARGFRGARRVGPRRGWGPGLAGLPGETRGRGQVPPQVRVWFGGREVVVLFPVLPGTLPSLPLTFGVCRPRGSCLSLVSIY